MTRRKITEPTACDAAQAKANEFHRSIGAAMEEIADQISGEMEIHVVISQGMFEAKLVQSNDGSEIPIHADFEEFADELLYLLNVAKGLRARNAALKVQSLESSYLGQNGQ